MRYLIQERILALRADENLHKHIFRARYKISNYDNRVCKTSTYISGSYYFIDNPPICANQRAPGAIESQAYNELQTRATGPFKIFEVHRKKLVIKDIEIPEIVSTDHKTHTPVTLLTASTSPKLQRCANLNPSQ